MINEFSSRVKPQSRLHNYLAAAGFLVGIAIFAIGASLESHRGLVQAICIIPFTLAIYLITRYTLCELYYDIIFDSEKRAMLTVRQRSGKRFTTLHFVHLSSILSVNVEREGDGIPSGISVYRFSPTLFPKRLYRITCTGRERCIIRLECSDEFAALLRDYSAEARSVEFEEE